MKEIQVILAEAAAMQREGRPGAAIRLYSEALSRRPGDPALSYMMGMALLQQGDARRAIELIERAATARPADVRIQGGLAAALRASGQPAQAASIYRKLVAADETDGRLWLALGDALHGAGQVRDAVEALEQAVTRCPSVADAHALLGRSRAAAGDRRGAIEAIEQALQLEPENSRYRRTLGDLLLGSGHAARAVETYRTLLRQAPDDGESLSMLGVALAEVGRYDEAETVLRQAAQLCPADGRVNFRLGRFLGQVGRMDEHVLLRWLEADRNVPAILRTAALDWLAEQDAIRDLANLGDDSPEGTEILREIAGNRVLGEALRRMIIDDPAVERAMTALRRRLCRLAAADAVQTDQLARLAADLAVQCHFNEYVYGETAAERTAVDAIEARVQEALNRGVRPDSFAVAVLASYRPLSRLPDARRLPPAGGADRDGALDELFRHQITGPAEEERLRNDIPCLAVADDSVSRAVREQYEEHPYPRWIRAPRLEGGSLQTVLISLFPFLAAEQIPWPAVPQILIAGCGTGLHALITAQRFPDASVFAVDLSLSSLAHAARRTKEAGIGNLDYAQCDILDVSRLDRRFDVIESAGVLHHMQDPMRGWKCLVEVLRPDGFMKVGLYSELGRQSVTAAREFVEQRGFAGTDQGIRDARQAIMALPEDHPARQILKRPDFYATSTCRDLLFHVQEHRFGLGEIATMLQRLGLEFIGFELASAASGRAYRERFPDDPQMRNLGKWAAFEAEHPGTFAGMYLFWVRRRK